MIRNAAELPQGCKYSQPESQDSAKSSCSLEIYIPISEKVEGVDLNTINHYDWNLNI